MTMNKTTLSFIAAAAVVVFAMWAAWQWTFCRFYVEPGFMAVVVTKTGAPVPAGQLLAQKGQRGVQEAVLTEGRHFLNPVTHEYTIYPVTTIPPGKIGIVTSKGGTELPAGEFLADPGQKGIWRTPLGPGKYRFNPVGYKVEIVDAMSIPMGYVGVVTSLSGKQPEAGQFAKAGEKGILTDVLQPGLYYVNPYAFKVDIVEIGVNQVLLQGKAGGGVITKSQIAVSNNAAIQELQSNTFKKQQEKRREYLEDNSNLRFNDSAPNERRAEDKKDRLLLPLANKFEDTDKLKANNIPHSTPLPAQMPDSAAFILNQFVEFPSKDGFEISLDMSVEFELLPENIAIVFRNYGDLPAAVDKIIMPQILSISRLKGSAYGARDFIVGEGRETFQKDLTGALAKTLGEKSIVVHNALIRHVNVPMQILSPIQQASVAQEQDLTNQEKQNTAKKQAELNTQVSLIEQAGKQVRQETEKLKAEIKAGQEKRVAEIGGETLKQVADIAKTTAAVNAEKVTTLGQAAAQKIKLVEGEKARGYQLKIQAFGDPVAYNLWTFASALSDNLKVNIIHSGPGTLWTDLQNTGLGELGASKLLNATEKKTK